MAVISLTKSRPDRRGVALLLVLAMVVLIIPVAVGFTQRALLASVEKRVSEQGQVADSIRAQLEAGPLLNWLSTESSKVVLDLEATSPRVDVLRDRWQFDDSVYEARVTAWDQCGMAPLASVKDGSALRTAIPAGILERINAADALQAEAVGLDQFGVGPSELERSAFRSAFPTPDEDDVLSVGAWIATHSVGENGSINVNTAPLPLVEAALAAAGRGGIEIIVAARSEGRLAPLPRALDRDNSSTSVQAPHLVGSSSAWGVRIDVRVGSVQRSWWAVYRQTSGRWECVQRLVIPD
ncbi:MAG: general secretion pathway protein GspK [Phycisphaerales bacterium]|nr:general secretion pathway protein GspK [Phycisphaerales bacterium]